MSHLVLLMFLLSFFSLADSKSPANEKGTSCEVNQHRVIGTIGAVIDKKSRVGKEQRIAVEMAVHDFDRLSDCSKLDLHFHDSQGNSARATSAAIDLVNNKQAHVILGTLTLQEAVLVWEFDKVSKNIPIISLTPSATFPPLLPYQTPAFITMSYDISIQMQCIAAIIGHFRWRKIIAIYERGNSFSADSALVTYLSDSLRSVESIIEDHLAFPSMNSLLDSEHFIGEELKRLRSKSVTVFTVLQSSLDFAIILFKKAQELGMIGKGYVWIVSDDIASLLDSVESSVLLNYMQGVIGFKTNYVDNSEPYKAFDRRFSRKYRTEYPEEEKHSSPSIYALRAYDATRAFARAMQNSQGKEESSDLIKYILANKFEGLIGKITFKNGALLQKPVFQIVNIIGKSYRSIALWSPEFGFSEDLIENGGKKMRIGNGLVGDFSSIYWPGGELAVPKGWTLGSMEKPLRIGVPAKGVFNQFVNVSYNPNGKKTTITGFSIEVFEAVVQQLPYHLPYVLVPFFGSYDEMVAEVKNKSLDAAVGDTEIMADRYKIADFSHPYMESGLVMVVTVKPDVTKTTLVVLRAFKWKMWILMATMSLSTGIVIWLNEHVNNNPEFRGPFPQRIGAMLWFSVSILSFAQRETIRHNLSRLVLSTWLFVTVVVTACFTAAVTSMMTIPMVEPSVIDINYLLQTNAPVGCNGNSFIVRYLVDILHFKPENIRKISSIHEYPKAFENRDIAAAFFVAPHAKIFLAEYCTGYTLAGPSFKLGGFGFVFPKGSPLAADISEAILQVTQSGAINQLEKNMLSFSNCSRSKEADEPPGLGIEPFYILFLISGSLLAVTCLNAMVLLAKSHWSIYGSIQESLIRTRVSKWGLSLLGQFFTMIGTRFFREPLVQRQNNEINVSATANAMEPTLRAVELAASSNI